ncbi:hypothetical protein DYU11_29460 [Fibrisoma montanum]|uniref:Uncharacterized protein n=1 Tax=Fibrisoma montanum TaxID=2305895 RepID=A0A418LXV9_9BACT|nr:hypothetical protein [Fibrisoma montanum]RIV18086.1 hypothetical protein DYU11_29460 [Fibrisoma montanum]
MEEHIAPTVLGAWAGCCGIWAWSQFRQAHWEHLRPLAQPSKHVKYSRRALSGILLIASGVIVLYWPTVALRSWLLPIELMNRPVINQAGLFVIKLALLWTVVMTMQRERWYGLWWRDRTLSLKRWRDWEPYYAGHAALAAGGLLLGLFITLSSGATALLCLIGWWLCWRMWRYSVLSYT